MMCRKEKTTILYHNQTFNTVNDKIKGKSMNILENIKYYAATSESRIAIKSGDSVLTYKQLEEYSNRLAAWINRNLSSNKVPIVVYGHKNPYMVVCF